MNLILYIPLLFHIVSALSNAVQTETETLVFGNASLVLALDSTLTPTLLETTGDIPPISNDMCCALGDNQIVYCIVGGSSLLWRMYEFKWLPPVDGGSVFGRRHGMACAFVSSKFFAFGGMLWSPSSNAYIPASVSHTPLSLSYSLDSCQLQPLGSTHHAGHSQQ